jgi:hypothetical protein
MPMFQAVPVTVKAVQFTGENWAEMHDFTGHKNDPELGHPVDRFNEIGTFLPSSEFPTAQAELWVQATDRWIPVQAGDWIVQGPGGFTPWSQRVFAQSFMEVAEVPGG